LYAPHIADAATSTEKILDEAIQLLKLDEKSIMPVRGVDSPEIGTGISDAISFCSYEG
jgi:hypothetical protein